MASDPEDAAEKEKDGNRDGAGNFGDVRVRAYARIETLEAEIARRREAIKARQATKAAADSFFKR